MRDFTWHVFTQTGDIEAYLLYKEMDALGNAEPAGADSLEPEPGGSAEEMVTP